MRLRHAPAGEAELGVPVLQMRIRAVADLRAARRQQLAGTGDHRQADPVLARRRVHAHTPERSHGAPNHGPAQEVILGWALDRARPDNLPISAGDQHRAGERQLMFVERRPVRKMALLEGNHL